MNSLKPQSSLSQRPKIYNSHIGKTTRTKSSDPEAHGPKHPEIQRPKDLEAQPRDPMTDICKETQRPIDTETQRPTCPETHLGPDTRNTGTRRAAEPAESATKIVSIFFQNGGQFERLIINQIYDIHYRILGFLGILEAWLQDHEENFFFEVIC